MNINDIERGITTRRFILENVDAYPAAIAKQTEQQFAISRQAVSKHIRILLSTGQLEGEGVTRNRRYWLKVLNENSISLALKKRLDEQVVWQEKMAPQLSNLPNRVIKIWRDGFIRMLNNALVHSSGKKVIITLRQTAVTTEIRIADDGEGIFKKIQQAYQLKNGKQAMLALSKGKLTTDPKNHAGKDIPFMVKKFDDFLITSKGTLYAPKHPSDWTPESLRSPKKGTLVLMKLSNKTVLTPIV